MAACNRFDIDLTGRGGHAAQPDRTRDPILAAAHVITALQAVVSRNVDPGAAAKVASVEMEIGAHKVRTIATLHPAYLLRTPAAKRLAWRDLLAVKTALEA